MGRRVDWSFGPGHGPISGVVNAAGAFLGATMVADVADTLGATVSPWWAVGAGLLASGASWLATRAYWQPPAVTRFRTSCWLGGGCWSAWTLSGLPWSEGTPWSVPSLATLGAGALAAGIIGHGLAEAERRRDHQQIDEQKAAAELAAIESAAATEDQIATVWTARLRKITHKDVDVVGVQMWDTETGYTLAVELPADGTTIDDIKRCEKALATAANLPPGCSVEVLATEEGRRTILVRVATVSALGEDHHLPEDYSAESVNNPLALGIAADRTVIEVDLRYSCAVMVGQTDSGKSNELNVITAGFARCTDALICAIDLSGNGRYPRLWVQDWAEGRAEAPAIDWVAATEEEAILMTTSLLGIINGRTAVYRKRMAAEGADKIMVAPDLPQIVLIVDEFKTLPQVVKDNIATIADTGRGAGVRAVCCALEAKERAIPRSIIAQSRVRIGMRVVDEAELQYLFDSVWSRGRFDPASLPYRGSGLVADGAVFPAPMKGYRVEPRQISRVAVAVAPLRPELDEESVKLGDTVEIERRGDDGVKYWQTVENVYTNRWERTLPVMFPEDDHDNTQPAPTSAPRPASATPAAGGPDLGAMKKNLNAALEAARAEAARAGAESPQDLPELSEEPDWSIVEGWLHPADTPEPVRSRPAPRRRMRQIVVDAAKTGIGPGQVHKALEAEQYPTTYPTVVDWMKKDLAAEILAQPGGDRTPYFPGPKIGDPHRETSS